MTLQLFLLWSGGRDNEAKVISVSLKYHRDLADAASPFGTVIIDQ